jgi:hypothetical protein
MAGWATFFVRSTQSWIMMSRLRSGRSHQQVMEVTSRLEGERTAPRQVKIILNSFEKIRQPDPREKIGPDDIDNQHQPTQSNRQRKRPTQTPKRATGAQQTDSLCLQYGFGSPSASIISQIMSNINHLSTSTYKPGNRSCCPITRRYETACCICCYLSVRQYGQVPSEHVELFSFLVEWLRHAA